ncbi:MAG TPA: hypothetical protein VD932_03510 [Aquabacterium sp.]|nr:hypothetical protein [Aquabacterium sp.]
MILNRCPLSGDIDFSQENFALACIGSGEGLGMHGLGWLSECEDVLTEVKEQIVREDRARARALGQGNGG